MLNESLDSSSTTHLSDHDVLRTAYLSRGTGRTLTNLTGFTSLTDYRAAHLAVHNTLHNEHNTLGAAVTLPINPTTGHITHHNALHAAHNLRTYALMPVGNLTGWTQIYAEDFNTDAAIGQVGNVYGTNMRGYDNVSDSSGNGTYSPDVVLSVSNSILDYYVHTQTINGVSRPRVATPIPMGYGGQTYGRYSVRWRADSIAGYKQAFLLWPASNVWNDGEIDGPETQVLGGTAYGASLKVGSPNSGGPVFDPSTVVMSPQNTQGWHVFTTEWTPGKVKWYWDGVLLSQTVDATKVPAIPMRWTLQVETALIGNPPTADASGHVQIDWIVAYSYTP